MMVSKIALAAVLTLGSASLIAEGAQAQRGGRGQPAAQPAQAAPQPGQREYNLSRAERAAIGPLQAAVQAQDNAAAAAALPAAQAAAQGADARYVVASLQLRLALATQNVPAQAQAIEAMVASGAAPPDQMAQLLNTQGALAAQGGNNQAAERAFTRLVELQPANADALVSLARVKNDLRKPQEAVTLLERAVAGRRAASQEVPEAWLKYALRLAYENQMRAETVRLSRDLVTAYPTPTNWRDSLLIFRERSQLDEGSNLDLMRLMRASQGLAGERDYYELAETLNSGGYPGEAKAVLDEGVQRRAVDAAKPTFRDLIGLVGRRITEDRGSLTAGQRSAMSAATGTPALRIGEAFFGYGRYAEAAALYQAALQKGGVDTNITNTRLGMALAMAGQRAEAEAAFRAVTGPRADLASLWLLWLSQRP